jgi:hypothetical protein
MYLLQYYKSLFTSNASKYSATRFTNHLQALHLQHDDRNCEKGTFFDVFR